MMINFVSPVIAHRGASGYAPENTRAAFTQAVGCGAKWLEFDVCFSSDGVPIVFHDKYLKRITGRELRPSEYPYELLKEMDAGTWFGDEFEGERVLSLREVLVLMHEYQLSANIEIKQLTRSEFQFLPDVLKLVKEFYPLSSEMILFSSFSLKVLHELRSLSAECHLGLLIHQWRRYRYQQARALNCVSLNCNQQLLTKQRVEEVKQHNLLLLAYTVNTKARAEELLGWGVDAIFSDYPDILSKK